MKKQSIFLTILLVIVFQVHGQYNSTIIADFINRTVSMLGGSVPSGFQRIDRTTFKNDEDIVLITENGIVVYSYVGSVFGTTGEAHALNGAFYDYFENNRNNWRFVRSTVYGTDIYLRNGVYARIETPSRRDDGLIVAGVGFSRNINDF